MELTTVGSREKGDGGCDDSGQDFALWMAEHRIDMLSQVGATTMKHSKVSRQSLCWNLSKSTTEDWMRRG